MAQDPNSIPPSVLEGRLIEVDGTFNFRDVGGVDTTDGSGFAPGRLFRSAGLDTLTDDGLAHIAELGIRTVVDLRGPHEVERFGTFPVDKFSSTHHPVTLVTPKPDFGPPVADDDSETVTDIRQRVFAADDPMAVVFEAMIEVFDQPLVQTLELISDPANLPAVFHCTSGKDRTGYLAAIIQLLVGVDKATVMDDFMASTHFINRILDDIEIRHPDMLEMPIERRRRMAGMDEAWLIMALDRIGGVEGIPNHLDRIGFGAEHRRTLVQNLRTTEGL